MSLWVENPFIYEPTGRRGDALKSMSCPACGSDEMWDAVFRKCYVCGHSSPVPGRWKTFFRMLLEKLN
jgi:hypothetical protein